MPEKLALHGGTPVVPPGSVQPWPHVTDEDRAAVAAVLASGNLAEQRQIQAEALAEEWAAYVGVRYALPTNSGTAALHIALAGAGVEAGDEVIVPAFTFWATAAAVLHHNAIPVFVDIDPRTFCIAVSEVEPRITERTRALLPVHIHGMPADMDPLRELAQRYGLALIEDACQAHGATYRGVRCGALGDAAGFSTQMSKNLTTGSEGGLFVTNDEGLFERARYLQYFGEAVIPGRERQDQEYNARGLGWMYRGDVFGQAFARSQLRRLDEYNAWRRENCAYLTRHLAELPGVHPPYLPADRESVFYNYVLGFYPEELGLEVPPRAFREKVQEALRAEGVDTGQWQRMPVPAQDIFQHRVGYGKGCPWRCFPESHPLYRSEDYPRTWEFLDRHAYLFGIHPPNGLPLMERYVEAIRKVLDQAETLFSE